MRFIFTFLIFSLFFSHSPVNAQESEKVEERKVIPPPNPLELEKDWWKYFDISTDDLPGKIELFKAQLESVLPAPEAPEHDEVVKTKNDVIFNLELLKQTVNQKVPAEPPRLQFLKEYSLSQILEVNTNFINSRHEISQTKDKLEFEKNRLNLAQSELDKQIINYYNLSRSSYERLLAGLKIMEYRIKVAVIKTKMDQLRDIYNYRVKEKDLLLEELKSSQKKVSYEDLVRADLSQSLQNSNSEVEKAKTRLQALEKEQLHKDSEELQSDLLCCLWNYQIITQTIRIEYLTIKSLIDEIKLTLLDIHEPETSTNDEEIKDRMPKWGKTLTRASELLHQWQKQLESDHAQVSRMIADMFKGDEKKDLLPGDAITDIHLQIDQSFALMEELSMNISGAEHLLKLVQNRYVKEKSFSETWLIMIKSNWAYLLDEIEERTSVSLFYVNELPVTLGTLLKALLTVIAAFVISKYLRLILSKRAFVTRRFSKSTQYIILRMIHYALIILSILIALSFIGLDMRNIAIVAGALGVGIGFGLQSMVNNILSGFTLLLNRYLKVGDIVEMSGDTLAVVRAVNLQFTHICTFDGADQIIPNSVLSTQGLTNWTMKNSFRRFKVPFGVAYGTDKEKLKKAILEGVEKESYVVKGNLNFANPQIWFKEFADSWLNFELVVWVDLTVPPPHGTATSSLLWEIDNILAANKFIVPYPQHDLFLKEVPENRSKSSKNPGS